MHIVMSWDPWSNKASSSQCAAYRHVACRVSPFEQNVQRIKEIYVKCSFLELR
jgi:hypothetical protein